MGHSRLGTWDPSRQGPTARSRTQHPQPPTLVSPAAGKFCHCRPDAATLGRPGESTSPKLPSACAFSVRL